MTTDELLDSIGAALDPERFLTERDRSHDGRSFLSGESDTVMLARSFLDKEATIERDTTRALDEIQRRISS